MEEIIQPANGQVTDETPKEPMKGKKESKKVIWILLVIIFFLLAGMVYFYIKSNENVTPPNVEEKETIEEEPEVEDNSNVTSPDVEEKKLLKKNQRIIMIMMKRKTKQKIMNLDTTSQRGIQSVRKVVILKMP